LFVCVNKIFFLEDHSQKRKRKKGHELSKSTKKQAGFCTALQKQKNRRGKLHFLCLKRENHAQGSPSLRDGMTLKISTQKVSMMLSARAYKKFQRCYPPGRHTVKYNKKQDDTNPNNKTHNKGEQNKKQHDTTPNDNMHTSLTGLFQVFFDGSVTG